MIGVTLFVVAVLVIGIWVILEVKRLKHRLAAILFIGGILFLYFTGYYVFKGVEVDYKSISGIIGASKTYFNWLLSVGDNFIEITGNVLGMDWKGNLKR